MGWNTNPFWIMTLREYFLYLYNTRKNQPPESYDYMQSLHPNVAGVGPWVSQFGDGGYWVFNRIDGRRDYDTFMVKLFPPKGWLCVSDMFISVPSLGTTNSIGNYQVKHTTFNYPGVTNPFWGPSELFDSKIVFVKDDPKYAIRCDIQIRGVMINNRGAGSICDTTSSIDGTLGNSDSGIYSALWKLGTTNTNYISPGMRWATISTNDSNLSFYGAIKRDFIEAVSYKNLKDPNTWHYNGGSLLAGGDETKGGCDYNAWSSVAYYDRDNSKNGNILNETSGGDDTINEGKFTYTSVFIATKPGWDWRDDDGAEGPKNILYVLHFEDTNRLCCINDTVMGAAECGLGLSRIKKGSSQCVDQFRKDCTATSPYFTTNYCLKNACRNNVKSDNPIVCDYELKNFCGSDINNYLKYPDMCSCFMSTKTLKGECDSMATLMKLTNNKPAKKVLNIDTEDPLQCTQNCLFHPLCKTAVSIVPSNSTYPTNRQGKYVQQGFMQDKANCGNRDVCIQTATVNAQGKIGSLEINQTANCGSYKSKMCQNSELSKCIYQSSSGEFVKQVITEKDGGNCGSSIESLSCASIDLSPLYDSGCKNGKRTLIYKQKKKQVNAQDVIDALKSVLPESFKSFNPSIRYEPVTNQAFIVMDCQDCVLDYELTGECYLEGNIWKVKGKKTKIVKQPLNGGAECKIDSSEKVIDCTGDADCAVSVKSQDSGCIKEGEGKVRNIIFNIDSYNSGNGMTCDDVITPLLPQLYKDNTVSITYSNDKKTAKASIDCRDCVVDYKIDQNSNGGECYLDDTGKMVINKIPYLKRQPLNGGGCDANLLKLIKNKEPVVEDCSFNQDCEFNSEPTTDNCISGERVFEFDIKTPPNGRGKSCEVMSKLFGVKYTNDTSKNTFVNDKLYIKTTCEKKEDCVLEDTPSQSACNIVTGEGVDIYKVLTKPKVGGKTCSEVASDRFKDATSIKEGTSTISITKKCSKPIDKKKLLYMAIALAAIILLIIVILLVV